MVNAGADSNGASVEVCARYPAACVVSPAEAFDRMCIKRLSAREDYSIKYPICHECDHGISLIEAGRVDKVTLKTCPVCGKKFSGGGNNGKYCTLLCKSQAKAKRAGRQVRPTLNLDPRPCRHCGTEYDPKARNQLFCSEKCNKAYASRKWFEQKERRLEALAWQTCEICGNKFKNLHLETRTCSKECSRTRELKRMAEGNARRKIMIIRGISPVKRAKKEEAK